MLTRNPYIRLSIYLLLLVAFGGWLFHLIAASSWFAVVPAIGVLWTGYRVIGLFNKLHEKVAYFFNAVENEDSTLYFPEDIGYRPTKELHRGLNRMNRLIQEVKLRNREQERFYSELLEQVGTGIMVMNGRGNVLQANSAAKRLLSYASLNHIEQLKRIDMGLYHAVAQLNEGASHQFVKIMQGHRVTQLSLHATNAVGTGQGLRIISIHDISNELDAKELESWQKLIRVLTHEIMNSITPITSLSQTLLSYFSPLPTEVDKLTVENTVKGLQVINERGEGLMRFVQSYRTLSKVSVPAIKALELKELLDGILLLMRSEEDFQRVHVDIDISPITIHADEAQLSQVFINLIRNALQAVEKVEKPSIGITAEQGDNGLCCITIADNGIGIAPELLDQIFIPFFTTRNEGSGIGLSLSRQIVQNHGGRLEVQSLPGDTRFVIRF